MTGKGVYCLHEMDPHMRKFLPLLALSALFLTGCESERSINGTTVSCIGLNSDPLPGVTYKYSTRNIVVGIIFSEMVIPPVIVAFNELQCPVSVTAPAPTIKPR